MRSALSYTAGLFKQRAPEFAGPTLLALSGGRSSAMLLKVMLEVHGGILPNNYVVVFTNTGKEAPETLDFLHNIEQNWNVAIVWLELSEMRGGKVDYKQVDYYTASRNGAPFEVLLSAKPNYPPRRSARLCTMYMKTEVSHLFAQRRWPDSQQKWTKLLGYRADESHRLYAALLRCGKPHTPYVVAAPLVTLNIVKRDVLSFFSQNNFNLELDDCLGNCSLCFLKGEAILQKAVIARPAEGVWWADYERRVGRYILPRGGYSALMARARGELPPLSPSLTEDLTDLECNCTD